MKKTFQKTKIIIGMLVIFFVVIGIIWLKNEKHNSSFIETVAPEEYNLELVDIEIEISGVKGEYVFLFMTDNQANFDDRADLGWFGNSESRCFRDSNGISAAENMTNWIQYANDSKVDAVLIGGDVIDFGSETNYEMLNTYISAFEMPYIYTYGNHDTYIPWEDRFDDDNKVFLQLFDDNNCEYQIMDMGEFYIMSIRNYQIDGIAQVSEETLLAFQELEKNKKPIILMCHVPIYTSETETLKNLAIEMHGGLVVEYNAGEHGTVNASMLMGENCGYEMTTETQKFIEEITKEDSLVVVVLSGHLHKNWQGYINDEIFQYVGDAAFLNKGALIYVSGEKEK